MAGKPQQFNAMTGLRGVGALFVFMDHSLLFPGSDRVNEKIARAGPSAVTMFFVLSGFIMNHCTRSCALAPGECRKSFYWKRFARIYPTYLLILLASLHTVDCLFEAAKKPCNIGQIYDIASSPVGLQSWIVLTGYSTWNGPGWSLSVELLLYICFPFGAAYMRRGAQQLSRTLWISLSMCILPSVICMAAFRMSYLNEETFAHNIVYRLALFRLGDFFLGAWVGIAAERYTRRLTGTAPGNTRAGAPLVVQAPPSRAMQQLVINGPPVLLIVIFVLFIRFAGLVGITLLDKGTAAPLFALVIFSLAVHPNEGWFAKFLTLRPVEDFGNYSYPFYLVHVTVGKTLEQLGIHDPTCFILVHFTTTLCLAIAIQEYWLIPVNKKLLSWSRWRCNCRAAPAPVAAKDEGFGFSENVPAAVLLSSTSDGNISVLTVAAAPTQLPAEISKTMSV
jgi:peptidoglycan/LPS O-acetylase OafA/YrhL